MRSPDPEALPHQGPCRRIDRSPARANNPEVKICPAAGSPRLVTLVAVLGWTAVLAAVVHLRWDSDPRALLSLGTHFQRPSVFDGVPRVGPHGYDAQFYAVLATDPLLRNPETAEFLDTPAYRAIRVGIPLLAWLLALGHAGLAVYFYQLLCWSMTLAAVALLAHWLKDSGHSPWWALAAASGSGLATTMLRVTVDGAAAAAVIAALLLHRRRQFLTGNLALVAAALIRETSLLAAAGAALATLRRAGWLRALSALSLPVAALLAWRGFLMLQAGGEMTAGTGNFAPPLAWVPTALRTLSRSPRLWTDPEFWGLAAVVVTLLGLAAGLARWLASGAAGLTLVAFGALSLVLSEMVFVEVYAYSRVLLLLPLLTLPVALADGIAWRRRLLMASVFAWAISGALLTRAEIKLALNPPEPFVRFDLHSELDTERRSTGLQPDGHLNSTPERVLFFVPAANTPGREGARWQTDLVLHNPERFPVVVQVEFLGHGGTRHNPPPRALELQARERRHVADAVGALFGGTGAGALRLSGPTGTWLTRAVTRDVTAPTSPDPLVPLTDRDQVTFGEVQFLAIPLPATDRPRVNVGAANVGTVPASVEIRLAGESVTPPLWHLEIPAGAYRQRDHLFQDRSLDIARTLTLEFHVLNPGARVLVFASLVGPQRGAVRYVFPT